MATIILDIDDALLKAVRKRAESEDMTLDEAIRCSLTEYVQPRRRTETEVKEAMAFLDRVRQYADTGGRKFTREEMNER